MAIFFNYIKGCGAKATNNNTALTNESWTFLKWADKSGVNTVDALPEIYITKNSTFNTDNNLGKIITSKATGQKIETDFIFNQTVTFNNIINLLNTSNKIQGTNNSLNITTPLLNLEGKFTTTEVITVPSLQVGNTTGTEVGSAFIQNKCEAKYFNATSDRRAKDNIRLSTFNGLDLVKTLQIYNFNYAEQKTPSIGIMAQDAAKHDIEDFELVTNKEATGENGDFMSIKESKLVYVLWKAVQELSAEVDDLKAQLKNK